MTSDDFPKQNKKPLTLEDLFLKVPPSQDEQLTEKLLSEVYKVFPHELKDKLQKTDIGKKNKNDDVDLQSFRLIKPKNI